MSYPLHHHLIFFLFTDTATTEIYTLSLHDALPIFRRQDDLAIGDVDRAARQLIQALADDTHTLPHLFHADEITVIAITQDRKSTRLNSSHSQISYAVFCLKKKKNTQSTATHESLGI